MRGFRRAALVVQALLCASPAVAKISFGDSEVGRCVNVTVSGCDSQANRCILKRGTKVNISVQFTPNHHVSVVKPKVYGVVYGLSIPFPLPHKNACDTSALKCPLAPGHEYTYTDAVDVKRMYPKLAVKVLLKLLDGKDKVICSVKIPSQIR